MTVKSPNRGKLKFLYKYNSHQSTEQNVEALAQIMRKAGFNIVDSEPNKTFEVVHYSSGRQVSITDAETNEGDKSEI